MVLEREEVEDESLRIDCPVLVTERLVLRPPHEDDLADLVALAGNRSIAEMLARMPHPYGEAEALAFIAGHGGSHMTLEAIPDAMVLAPVEFEMDEDGDFHAPDGAVGDQVRPGRQVCGDFPLAARKLMVIARFVIKRVEMRIAVPFRLTHRAILYSMHRIPLY